MLEGECEADLSFGIGQLDDFQTQALVCRRLSRLLARVTLIDKRQFDTLASGLLNFLGQPRYLGTILLIYRCHMQCQQMAEGVDREVGFAPHTPFGTS